MAEIISLPYLQALQGKFVRVFKGGPDSREGRLIEVNDEYIVLLTEEKQLVYYTIAQLKIVVVNAKKSQEDVLPPFDDGYAFPPTFVGLLETLDNRFVQVNGGGPASKIGQIVEVTTEYIVLSTKKDGLVLFPIALIKSVAIVEVSFRSTWPEFPDVPNDTLNGALTQLIYSWISVHAGGPEKVEGVLIQVEEDYIVVVNKDEIFYITTDQIQSIGLFFPRENDGGGKDKDKDKNKESSSHESSSRESSSHESSSSESSSSESSSSESSSSESSSSESSSYESSSSCESSSHESSSCECIAPESSSSESSSYESSSSCESSSSYESSSSCESSSSFESSSSCESSSSPESSDECKKRRRRHRKDKNRTRVNTFKKIWLENLIKVSKTTL
ncbi:DUF2642 domain-containing protein [Peribacillus sp. NPDC046944]|uniref:DUF2642 domain-containing protein n=1 Tax=unclassified Peribacillus TaxID=2675266 RepID=UPI00382D5E52